MSASASAVRPQRRWSCVNKHKNESITILFHCTWSGKEFPIPAEANAVDAESNFFDEPNEVGGGGDGLLFGSMTLKEAMKQLKKSDPALFLMEEHGGIEMHCGQNTVCGSEWAKTMLCHLIYDQPSDVVIPRVTLGDGREAVVITLGTKGDPLNKRPSVVTRCLAKGDTYG